MCPITLGLGFMKGRLTGRGKKRPLSCEVDVVIVEGMFTEDDARGWLRVVHGWKENGLNLEKFAGGGSVITALSKTTSEESGGFCGSGVIAVSVRECIVLARSLREARRFGVGSVLFSGTEAPSRVRAKEASDVVLPNNWIEVPEWETQHRLVKRGA